MHHGSPGAFHSLPSAAVPVALALLPGTPRLVAVPQPVGRNVKRTRSELCAISVEQFQVQEPASC